MSRIGKLPIQVPSSVTVSVDGSHVTVTGIKGALSFDLRKEATVAIANGVISVVRTSEDRFARAYHGLVRSLLANMVKGVSEGWTKTLEMTGVGYRSEVSGDTLKLSVGFSHPVVFKAPKGITFTIVEGKIIVSGADKGLVGETAACIRRVRPPEPYKGKGIHYVGEHIRRKAGKAGKVGATGAGAK